MEKKEIDYKALAAEYQVLASDYQMLAFDMSVATIISTTNSLLRSCDELFNEYTDDLFKFISSNCNILNIAISGLKKATGINYRTISKYGRYVRDRMSKFKKLPKKPTEIMYCLEEIRSHVWALARDASKEIDIHDESSDRFFKWLENYERRKREKEKSSFYLA